MNTIGNIYNKVLLNHYGCPSVLVLNGAILDAAERVVKLLRPRTGLAVLREDIAVVVVEVVDVRNGADDGSCSASTGFLKCRELLFGNGAALYLHTQVFSHLQKAAVGDTGKD